MLVVMSDQQSILWACDACHRPVGPTTARLVWRNDAPGDATTPCAILHEPCLGPYMRERLTDAEVGQALAGQEVFVHLESSDLPYRVRPSEPGYQLVVCIRGKTES